MPPLIVTLVMTWLHPGPKLLAKSAFKPWPVRSPVMVAIPASLSAYLMSPAPIGGDSVSSKGTSPLPWALGAFSRTVCAQDVVMLGSRGLPVASGRPAYQYILASERLMAAPPLVSEWVLPQPRVQARN